MTYFFKRDLRSRKWLEIYVTVKCALYGIKSIPLDCISFHSNSAPIFSEKFLEMFLFLNVCKLSNFDNKLQTKLEQIYK